MSGSAATDRRGGGRWSATALGVVGIVLWATETALASATAGLPPFEVTGLAFGFAALLSPLAWRIGGGGPLAAFRQPWRVWAVTVPSLVAYHACIYYAVHQAPAAPAALPQGCTPLFLVFGTALCGGQRLRWWHMAGMVAGLEGLVALTIDGRGFAAFTGGASPYLLLIGLAAGLWGIYSLVTSRFASVPTSAMGVFYAAAALAALACHAGTERWVAPTLTQWSAIAGLGFGPMGLALLLWDHGLKRGDVQALGVASYVEPLIGAALVAALGQGELRGSMLVSGLVIIGGAVLGAADAFGEDRGRATAEPLSSGRVLVPLPFGLHRRVAAAAAAENLDTDVFIARALTRALRNAGQPPIRPARFDAPGRSRAA